MALSRQAGCFQMFVGVESFNRQALLAAREGAEPPGDVPRHRAAVPRAWNQPALFQHHRLPPGHGAEVDGTWTTLRDAAPDVGVLLRPHSHPRHRAVRRLPAAGLISKRNLDRFDGSTLTWRHPSLVVGPVCRSCCSESYRELFRLARPSRRSLARLARAPRDFRTRETLLAVAGTCGARRGGSRRTEASHGGGAGRVSSTARRTTSAAPPRLRVRSRRAARGSLRLSAGDAELNRAARLAR